MTVPVVKLWDWQSLRGRTTAIGVASVVPAFWSLPFVFSVIVGFLPAAASMTLATVQATTEGPTGPSGHPASQT